VKTNRLEAFSDGVFAIIITIMVLEFKVPHGAAFQDLQPLWPVLVSYVLSFIYVGIYWNNHHHIFHLAKSVNGAVLWANMNVLFWLSLLPFVTAWMGENHFAAIPMAVYCFDLLMCAVASFILLQAIYSHEGPDSALQQALGDTRKFKLSLALSVLSVPVAFAGFTAAAGVLVTSVAALWVMPERRIEKALSHPDVSP
jgi:uncharacterized membrane protein